MQTKSKLKNFFPKMYMRFRGKKGRFPRKFCGKYENDFWESLTRTTMVFGGKTTLHGFHHIVKDVEELAEETERVQKFMSWISLVIWCATVFLGITFCVYLMLLLWQKFQTTPTITTVETNNYPISNVQFPAVTICNSNKVYAPSTKNITEKLLAHGFGMKNITNYLSILARLVYPERTDSSYYEMDSFVLNELNYTVDSLMMELMQPCSNLITFCIWISKSVPCDTLFRVAKSAEGFCCAFNSRALKSSLEIDSHNENVANQLNIPVYQVSGFGESVGLQVRLHTDKRHYMSYSNSFYGIKVLVNEPEDFPEMSVSTVIVQPSYDVSIAVIPSVIVSVPEVRGLPLWQRNCMFDDEKKLRTTDEYGYQSCVTECILDEILRICDCVPFYYPQILMPGTSTYAPQCSVKDINCLRENQYIFSSMLPDEEIIGYNNTVLEGMDCNCYPSCSEQSYEVEVMQSLRFQSETMLSRLHLNTTVSNYTMLKVYFKDISCIKYRRDMFKTWDDLFASFGGIFGLCLGGSVMSMIEMIYYFTFRFYHNLMIEKDKLKKEENKEKGKDTPLEVNLDSTIKTVSSKRPSSDVEPPPYEFVN